MISNFKGILPINVEQAVDTGRVCEYIFIAQTDCGSCLENGDFWSCISGCSGTVNYKMNIGKYIVQ